MKSISLIMALIVFVMISISGCSNTVKGAGQDIQKAGQETGKDIQKAGQETGKDIQKAGQQVENAAK